MMALEIGERRACRGRPANRRAPLPAARRADPRRDLHLGGEPLRTNTTAQLLHEPTGSSSCSATRSTNGTRPRTSGCPACIRTTATPSSLDYLRSESTGEPFAMEYRYLHKDGRIVWVADQAILMSREDGRPEALPGRDDRRLLAQGRRSCGGRDRAALPRPRAEQVPGVIYVADLNPLGGGYRLRYASPQLTTLFGYELADWGDTERWLATVHPEASRACSGRRSRDRRDRWLRHRVPGLPPRRQRPVGARRRTCCHGTLWAARARSRASSST